jgi:hypothetical protein
MKLSTSIRFLCLLAFLHCLIISGMEPVSVLDNPSQTNRWSIEKVNHWYEDQPWLVGTNFGPSNAINQLEMWQADTFDPETIDRELALSASIGMNSHRVYLHNLLWEQDSDGFLDRLDQFLEIADKHGIKTMPVLFDGVWNPHPKLGKQPEPVPYRHNSGWVQSPGATYLKDKSTYPKLEAYVKGVMSHLSNDDRVIFWDLFNEPENGNLYYPDTELPDKYDRVFDLLREVFGWAREVNPSQPLTAGVWGGFIGHDGLNPDELTSISEFMLSNSDIITFHNYETPEVLPRQIKWLKQLNRPIICTEYLARSRNNNFLTILTLFKEHNIGAYNWGFVSGKTNTIYPWDSWELEYTGEPELWHHDIFRSDGTPYREEEVALIKRLTSE